MHNIILQSEKEIQDEFRKIEDVSFFYSEKVLNAFHKYRLSESHFNTTTGYGYNDIGREVIESIFADVLHGEDALVRSQFISGSHALTVALFAFLRPGDKMLSITGKPYDTLDEVIGITENDSSLKSYPKYSNSSIFGTIKHSSLSSKYTLGISSSSLHIPFIKSYRKSIFSLNTYKTFSFNSSLLIALNKWLI